MSEQEGRPKALSTRTYLVHVPSKKAKKPSGGNGMRLGMKTDYVYLLTLTEPRTHAWQLAGVFLDPVDAKQAMSYLISQGVDEDLLDIDFAPVGIVSTHGVDEPYSDGPLH